LCAGHFVTACRYVASVINRDPGFFSRFDLRVTEVSGDSIKGRIARIMALRRSTGATARSRPSGGMPVGGSTEQRVTTLLDEALRRLTDEEAEIAATRAVHCPPPHAPSPSSPHSAVCSGSFRWIRV
jgi:hypothetical protein